jgi:hypothetical protein
MKVAKARYTGSMSSHSRRVPSGETYTFPTYSAEVEDGREWKDIDNVEDAKHLEEQPVIEVEWTPMGRLRSRGDDIKSAISDLGYEAKQKLVGEDGFDLDVPGNASGDEMEEALKQHVEEIDQAGEP